jgi:hypothetical protein
MKFRKFFKAPEILCRVSRNTMAGIPSPVKARLFLTSTD